MEKITQAFNNEAGPAPAGSGELPMAGSERYSQMREIENNALAVIKTESTAALKLKRLFPILTESAFLVSESRQEKKSGNNSEVS